MLGSEGKCQYFYIFWILILYVISIDSGRKDFSVQKWCESAKHIYIKTIQFATWINLFHWLSIWNIRKYTSLISHFRTEPSFRYRCILKNQNMKAYITLYDFLYLFRPYPATTFSKWYCQLEQEHQTAGHDGHWSPENLQSSVFIGRLWCQRPGFLSIFSTGSGGQPRDSRTLVPETTRGHRQR